MAEIDLIPGRYRRSLLVRSWARILAISCATLIAALGVGKVGLVHKIREQEQDVQRLIIAKEAVQERTARLEKLRGEESSMEQRLAILSQLRGGVAARQMFLVVDRALDGNVWFTSWKFRREGEFVKNDPDLVNTGYFIVVPKGSKKETERAWRMRAHMEIHAQAVDHSALAGFVQRLLEQPEIEDVRILDTQVRRYTSVQVVGFELAVILNTQA